ncbi:Alp7A family actin-like protein [Psychrobacter sp. AOP31-A1-22]|uniref:Alp7A family actin-like protein n=1 Tax=Psychrobacter sp. AOP31-A1-22 TaxID=3457696 RepID=UPI0040350F54
MTNNVNVGIDDGHDGIKVYFGSSDGVSAPVMAQIQSKAQKGLGEGVDVSEAEQARMTIKVDGIDGGEPTTFLVNEDFVSDKIDTRTETYPYSALNLALITQAIRQVRPALEGVTGLKIIAGLPANQYYDKVAGGKNDVLIDKKMANLKTLSRAYSPADKHLPNEGRFDAIEAEIMPEGYGIAFNLMFDDDLKPTEYYEQFRQHGCVIVDIGGRTVDVVTVMPRTCKPKGSDLLSFDKGVLYLREIIGTTLTERLNLKMNLNDNSVDMILKTGWFGRKNSPKGYDATKDLEEIKLKHVKEIYSAIKGALDSNEAMGGVILSGGGGVLLGDMLKDVIDKGDHPCEVILPDEMVFGNAKGFWKLTWLKYK